LVTSSSRRRGYLPVSRRYKSIAAVICSSWILVACTLASSALPSRFGATVAAITERIAMHQQFDEREGRAADCVVTFGSCSRRLLR